jgi:hypothetical protein
MQSWLTPMRRTRPTSTTVQSNSASTRRSLRSIRTLAGCQKIPFVCGERQHALFTYRKGEVDLCWFRLSLTRYRKVSCMGNLHLCLAL